MYATVDLVRYKIIHIFSKLMASVISETGSTATNNFDDIKNNTKRDGTNRQYEKSELQDLNRCRQLDRHRCNSAKLILNYVPKMYRQICRVYQAPISCENSDHY